MRDRIREQLSRTSRHPGQVLVLFALLIPAMLGVAGLGIDVAHLYKERRQLQNAVDIAALGGAMMLPDDPASAEATAHHVADLNGVPSGSITASAGYGGDDTQLEVTATRSVGLFFMPILGIDTVNIDARAVAEHKITRGTAVFAKKDYMCFDLVFSWTGNDITVDGDIHTNSGMQMYGKNNTLTGNLTYQEDGGPMTENNQWARLKCGGEVKNTGGSPSVPKATGTSWRDWPIDLKPSDFPCNVTVEQPNLTDDVNKHLWVDNNIEGRKLKPGVICYTKSGTLTLNASGVTGNVTLVAKNITVNGANNNLTAFSNDVLFFAYGETFPSMRITANGGTMNGILYQRRPDEDHLEIYNRRGQIIITGSNGFRLNGTIVSWMTTLQGSNWSIVNTLEGSPEPVRLVE